MKDLYVGWFLLTDYTQTFRLLHSSRALDAFATVIVSLILLLIILIILLFIIFTHMGRSFLLLLLQLLHENIPIRKRRLTQYHTTVPMMININI
jgi:hypothetical protein